MLGPLLRSCVMTVGVTLVVLAVGASFVSLALGLHDLSRRADCALMSLETTVDAYQKAAKPVPASVFDALQVDPDILTAVMTVGDSAPTVVFEKTLDPHPDAAIFAALAKASAWFGGRFSASQAYKSDGAQTVVVAITYSTDVGRSRAAYQLILFLVGAAIALLLGALALRIVFGAQMRMMRALTLATRRLADDDFATIVPCVESRDEIGAIARAIESFKVKLVDRERLRETTDIAHRTLADRHARIDVRVDEFRSSIGKALDEVAGLSDQMTVAADSLATISTETSTRAGEAVDAIRQTSASVTSVAGASEDLFSSIRDIERQVEQTRAIVLAATRSTAETGAVVKGLYAKAEAIDEIIGLIQSIAAQTNLLSLNATIEAARAGESGRGFAVVAQEVKTLASQTARASQHVADHVRAIQDATSHAVEAIETIDATMMQAEQFSAVIAVAVEKQATATAEISRGAGEAARTAHSAAVIMKRLAAAVGETDQSAAQVHQSASDVGRQASDLSQTVDTFLKDTATLRSVAG